jgi:polyhydroxybutyrate depolymerase
MGRFCLPITHFACLLGLSLIGIALVPARAEPGCPLPSKACLVAGGEYMAELPPGWDGRKPLPALVHFHGFRESASDIMAREDVKAFAAKAGLLLIIPQGAGQTWSHTGSPSQNRDEFAFVAAVLADAKARWPINEALLWASGFSQGASMLWNIACHQPQHFSAYLAIAGAFWRPEPESCVPGIRRFRHIHGLADRTVPLEGRPIRSGAFHQGDVFRAMGLMRRAIACTGEEKSERRIGALTCEARLGCEKGAALEFCLHAGTHDFDPSWLEQAWEWVLDARKE